MIEILPDTILIMYRDENGEIRRVPDLRTSLWVSRS